MTHAALHSAQDSDTDSQRAYALFAAFRVSTSDPLIIDGRDVPAAVQQLEDITNLVEDESVTVRGWYDVSGTRNDADLLVWLHGPNPEDLQWSLRQLRRADMLQPLIRTWGALVLQRAGEDLERAAGPLQWLAVCSNTLLPLEADSLAELADPLQELLAAQGRTAPDDIGYVSFGTPFYTGRNIAPAEIIEVLQ